MTLAELIEPADWMDGAICNQVDPELFFPDKGGTTAPAKAICGGCDVRAECLTYALEHDEPFGIWGGLSVTERDRLTGRHRFASAPTQWCPDCADGPFTVRGLRVHRSQHCRAVAS